jgi:hypothetical protein
MTGSNHITGAPGQCLRWRDEAMPQTFVGADMTHDHGVHTSAGQPDTSRVLAARKLLHPEIALM